MNKFNPYEYHEKTTIRQLQVVFLANECGLSNREIADITEYAIGTVRIYIKKYANMLEVAREYFDINACAVAPISTPIVESVLYRKFKNGKPAVAMEFMTECGENLKDEQAVYFFKFYDENALLFNKIGTTSKDIISRLRQEISDYSKKFNIVRVEIHRMRPCGNIPAEGAESALRAEFCKRYPNAFRKNDRFFNVDISPEDFDLVYNQYFA